MRVVVQEQAIARLQAGQVAVSDAHFYRLAPLQDLAQVLIPDPQNFGLQ